MTNIHRSTVRLPLPVIFRQLTRQEIEHRSDPKVHSQLPVGNQPDLTSEGRFLESSPNNGLGIAEFDRHHADAHTELGHFPMRRVAVGSHREIAFSHRNPLRHQRLPVCLIVGNKTNKRNSIQRLALSLALFPQYQKQIRRAVQGG